VSFVEALAKVRVIVSDPFRGEAIELHRKAAGRLDALALTHPPDLPGADGAPPPGGARGARRVHERFRAART